MTRTERQELAVQRWKDAGCKASIVAATGFGKTRVAFIALRRVLSKNPNIKTVIVVPTNPLKKQWLENIEASDLHGDIEVMVINTAIKKPFFCNFLIIDELHRAAATSFARIFTQCSPQLILGLTATYERLDEREKEITDKYCPPCDYITIKEATENGWLAPYREYKVMLDIDLTEYMKANEEFMHHFSFFDYKFDIGMKCATNLYAQMAYAKKINCEIKEVRAHAYSFMRALQFRKKFIANHPKKIEVAKKIIAARKDKKIITFDSSIKQCESYGMGYTVHSDKKQKENLAIIEEFAKLESGVIHSSKMLTEGLDCPGLSVAIITGFNSSKINARQELGRVIRYEPGKSAEVFVLVLRGTVEETWFKKSREGMDFIIINEEELDQILNNEELNKTVHTQEKTNNLFRY